MDGFKLAEYLGKVQYLTHELIVTLIKIILRLLLHAKGFTRPYLG